VNGQVYGKGSSGHGGCLEDGKDGKGGSLSKDFLSSPVSCPLRGVSEGIPRGECW
jgi:hypothetical protein